MKIYPGNHYINLEKPDAAKAASNTDETIYYVTQENIPLAYFKEASHNREATISIDDKFVHSREKVYPFKSFKTNDMTFFNASGQRVTEDNDTILKYKNNKYQYVPTNSEEYALDQFEYSILVKRNDIYRSNIDYNLTCRLIGTDNMVEEDIAFKLCDIFNTSNTDKPNNIYINKDEDTRYSLVDTSSIDNSGRIDLLVMKYDDFMNSEWKDDEDSLRYIIENNEKYIHSIKWLYDESFDGALDYSFDASDIFDESEIVEISELEDSETYLKTCNKYLYDQEDIRVFLNGEELEKGTYWNETYIETLADTTLNTNTDRTSEYITFNKSVLDKLTVKNVINYVYSDIERTPYTLTYQECKNLYDDNDQVINIGDYKTNDGLIVRLNHSEEDDTDDVYKLVKGTDYYEAYYDSDGNLVTVTTEKDVLTSYIILTSVGYRKYAQYNQLSYIIQSYTDDKYMVKGSQIYGDTTFNLELENEKSFNLDKLYEIFDPDEYYYSNIFLGRCPIIIIHNPEKEYYILSSQEVFSTENAKIIFEVLIDVYLVSYFETNKRKQYITSDKITYYIKKNSVFGEYHPRINVNSLLYEDNFNSKVSWSLVKTYSSLVDQVFIKKYFDSAINETDVVTTMDLDESMQYVKDLTVYAHTSYLDIATLTANRQGLVKLSKSDYSLDGSVITLGETIGGESRANYHSFLVKYNYNDYPEDSVTYLALDKNNNILFKKNIVTNDIVKKINQISVFTTNNTVINYYDSNNVMYLIEEIPDITYLEEDDVNKIVIETFKSSKYNIYDWTDSTDAREITIADDINNDTIESGTNYTIYYNGYSASSYNGFNVVKTSAYSSTFTDSSGTLRDNIEIATFYINSDNSLTCGDLRKYGGGEIDASNNTEMVDTGYIEGKPYRIGSTMIIQLPLRLKKYESILESEIKKHMASADYPILVFK